ncbi:hypothetical protein HYW18_01010 [Candidatus Uhrbacteria bacterium]|nr:hypothetical protein [Candidatus Uhrbacteria bacterium]
MTRIFAAQFLSLLALMMFVGCTPGTPVESPTGDDDPVADDDGNGDDDTVEYGSAYIDAPAPITGVHVTLTPTDTARTFDVQTCDTVCNLVEIPVGVYRGVGTRENTVWCDFEIEIATDALAGHTLVGGYGSETTFTYEKCLDMERTTCNGTRTISTADAGDEVVMTIEGHGQYAVDGDQIHVIGGSAHGTVLPDLSRIDMIGGDGTNFFFFKL